MAADSLVARRRTMPKGGWAWRSSIQAPHYHTDRDVGAASVGEGLLAAYAVTGDRALPARRRGGGRLPARRGGAGGGRPALARLGRSGRTPVRRRISRASTTVPPGSATTSGGCSRSRTSRVSAPGRSPACAGWSRRQRVGPARRPPARGDGPTIRRWRVAYYGVGMGQAGIVLALDTFADRTDDSTFRAYARAGAARLRALTANGTRPLPRGELPSRARPSRPASSPARPAPRTCSSSATGAIAIPPISRRRAGCSLGRTTQAVVGRRREGSAGRSPATREPGPPRASSSASPGSPGSTCRPPGRPATPPTARLHAGPEAG